MSRSILALSLTGLLLLGGCVGQSAVPEESASQETMEILKEKYGLYETTPTPPPPAWDWGANVQVYLPDGSEVALPAESPFSFERDGVYWTLRAEEWTELGQPTSLTASIGGSDPIEGIYTEEEDGITIRFPFDPESLLEEYLE